MIEKPDDALIRAQSKFAEGRAKFAELAQYMDPIVLSMSQFLVSKAAEGHEALKQMAQMGVLAFGTELEGGEVVENELGAFRVKGPSHEQGGVPAVIRHGKDRVFSNVLSLDGEAISDRKAKRMKALETLRKKLEKRPHDRALQNTYKRLKQVDEAETQKELAFQTLFKKVVFGTEPPAMAFGSDPIMPEDSDTFVGNAAAEAMQYMNLDAQEEGSFWQKALKFGDKFKSGTTAGDAIGLGAQILGMIKPFEVLERNRAGDRPTPNFYEDYGKEALETYNTIRRGINQRMSLEEKKADALGRSMVRNAQNMMSSSPAQTAAAIAALTKASQMKSDILAKALGVRVDADTRRASLEERRSDKIAAGAKLAYFTDEANRDNYFSELSKAWANVATGWQHFAKNINAIKERNTRSALINDISKYFTFDPISGKFYQKSGMAPQGSDILLRRLNGEDSEFLKALGMKYEDWLKLPQDKRIQIVLQTQ